ncbi:hypothetical protein EB093_04260, partial [bacterium]|nr:hypothetical protein [bacterium]
APLSMLMTKSMSNYKIDVVLAGTHGPGSDGPMSSPPTSHEVPGSPWDRDDPWAPVTTHRLEI